MSKEAGLDHWFEPQEEYPRTYKPPGIEIRRGDLTEWKEWMPLYTKVTV